MRLDVLPLEHFVSKPYLYELLLLYHRVSVTHQEKNTTDPLLHTYMCSQTPTTDCWDTQTTLAVHGLLLSAHDLWVMMIFCQNYTENLSVSSQGQTEDLLEVLQVSIFLSFSVVRLSKLTHETGQGKWFSFSLCVALFWDYYSRCVHLPTLIYPFTHNVNYWLSTIYKSHRQIFIKYISDVINNGRRSHGDAHVMLISTSLPVFKTGIIFFIYIFPSWRYSSTESTQCHPKLISSALENCWMTVLIITKGS